MNSMTGNTFDIENPYLMDYMAVLASRTVIMMLFPSNSEWRNAAIDFVKI